MRLSNSLLAVFFLSVAICSCGLLDKKKHRMRQEDSFYTDAGGLLDLPRIPLLKPYELLRSGNEWRMELNTPVYGLSVHNVRGVKVSRNRILIHSVGGTQILFGTLFKDYEEAWFIIDSSTHKERAFVNEKKYKDTLRSLRLTDTALLMPTPLYASFEKSGRINWQR